MSNKRKSLRERVRRAEFWRAFYERAYNEAMEAHNKQTEWIFERMQKTCNTCQSQARCPYAPEWGEPVRWNCPHFKGGESQ